MVTTRANGASDADGSAGVGIAYMCAGVFCLTINDALAVLLGWVFWGEIPSRLAVYGIVVIVVCGIYLAYKHGAGGNRRAPAEASQAPRGE